MALGPWMLEVFGIQLPVVRIGDATTPEGGVGETPATLTVTLDRPWTADITVPWTTEPQTASQDDFLAAAGDLTIPAGQVSGQITVHVLGDTVAPAGDREGAWHVGPLVLSPAPALDRREH